MARGTVAAVGLARVARAAALAGVRPELLPVVDFSADAGLETRLPLEDVLLFWERVMRATREPGLPVRMAEHITPSDYDAIGFACMTRATVGEALQQAVRFARVWTDASRWVLTVSPAEASLEFQIDDPLRLGVRIASESLVAEMIQGGRTLTGSAFEPARVCFRPPAPADVSRHAAFFRSPIEWSAPRTEIVVHASLLDQPLVRADPALAAYFERHASELLARFPAEPEALEYRLRGALAEELRSGLPTLESIAPRLGMSSRTLRRRLKDDGTSFQELLDSTRCELAKRYLADGQIPVGAVGFLLGFSEPSTFHRAFKRWTGSTPLAFRRSAGAAA